MTHRTNADKTGRAYAYFGSAAGLAAAPALILSGTDEPGGNFG